MSKAGEEHIEAVSKSVFDRARLAAFIRACEDARLVGANELRAQIAYEAAFRATGAKHKRQSPPFGRAGLPIAGTQEMIDEIITACTEKARDTLAPAE